MNRITKKSLAILIIAVLLSSFMPNLISNAAEPSITATESTTGKTSKALAVGDIVSVDFKLENGLENYDDAFVVTIEYDKEHLEAITEVFDADGDGDYADNMSDEIFFKSGNRNTLYGLSKDNKIGFTYMAGYGAFKTSAKLATLNFKVLKGGETQVKVTSAVYSQGTEETNITDLATFNIIGKVPMTGLNTEKVSKNLFVGETAEVKVSKLPVDTTDESVISYISSNDKIAKVDNNGLVTAISNGNATITAKCTSDDGKDFSVECGTIAVDTPLTSVKLNKESATLHKNDTLKLIPTTNENVSKEVKYSWTSSDTDVVTVSNDGTVTGIGVGTATVTVTATAEFSETEKFTKTATCEFTVDSPLTGLELKSNKDVYLEIGAKDTAVMEVVPVPGDTTDNKTITFSSNNEAVVTVDSEGNLTAVGEGTAIVTAKCGSFSVSCNVKVTIHINSVEINREDFELYVAQDPVQLNVNYNPEVFTDQSAVEWSSNDNTIVKVENGKVTALKPGTAKIKATLKSNSAIYDEVNITVPEVKAAGVILNTSKVTIEKYAKENTKLNVKLVEPEGFPTTDDLDNLSIDWTSSDESIVKVEKGEHGEANLVPVATGEAKVTVKVGDYKTVECEVTVVCALEDITLKTANGKETTLVIKDEKTPETLQLQLEKTPNDADAKIEDAKYVSSVPEVATVDNTGLVTAVKPGKTVITATLDGISKTIEVTVEALLTDVEIENETEDLIVYKNKTAELKVNKIPSYATIIPEAKWSSDDESIATVDAKGVVKGIKVGTTTITVSYTHEDGTIIKATRDIVVKEVKATGVTVTVKPESILKNEESIFEFEVSKDNNEEELTDEIYVSSSDEKIAYVVYSNGVYKVVGVKEGKVEISVKAGDYSETFDVEVKEIHIESIKAEIEGGKVTEGEKTQIKVTVNPDNTTDDKKFTYKVENESVAKVIVDKNGLAYIQGINPGKTTVTVTSENGVKSAFEVTVAAKPVVSGGGNNSNVGGVSSGAASEAVSGLVGSPHTGDMNIIALSIMAIASLVGMIIMIKKK